MSPPQISDLPTGVSVLHSSKASDSTAPGLRRALAVATAAGLRRPGKKRPRRRQRPLRISAVALARWDERVARARPKDLLDLADELHAEAGPAVSFDASSGAQGSYQSLDDILADFELEISAVAPSQAADGPTEADPPDEAPRERSWKQILYKRPQKLGLSLKDNKSDRRDTRMQMGLHLFEPLRVYHSLLQWPDDTDPVPGEGGASWLELLLDHWCCTRVEMKPMGCPKTGRMRDQVELFAAASRRVAVVCGCKLRPSPQTHKVTSLGTYGQPWASGFCRRPQLLFPDMVHKILAACQRRVEEASEEERADGQDPFWDAGIPNVELPDPIWTVDARYDILSGGTRPGGALSILWDKICAEVEESNVKATREGLHLIQLPGSPEGEVVCTRCGARKSWQHFHTFARRRCKGAATAVDENGNLLQNWKDVGDTWRKSRRKATAAKRTASLAAKQPGLTAAEVECLAGTEEHPRPCDPKSVRALRARTHAERRRRVERGDWSPAREFPDRRHVAAADLPAVESRAKLQEELVAWEIDRRKCATQPRGKKGVTTSVLKEGPHAQSALSDEQRRKQRRREANAKHWAKRRATAPGSTCGRASMAAPSKAGKHKVANFAGGAAGVGTGEELADIPYDGPGVPAAAAASHNHRSRRAVALRTKSSGAVSAGASRTNAADEGAAAPSRPKQRKAAAAGACARSSTGSSGTRAGASRRAARKK